MIAFVCRGIWNFSELIGVGIRPRWLAPWVFGGMVGSFPARAKGMEARLCDPDDPADFSEARALRVRQRIAETVAEALRSLLPVDPNTEKEARDA